MGQYYHPCIVTDEDDYEITTYSSHDYGSGSKLMEHSYIGNRFADQIVKAVKAAGIVRFAHVGDYWKDYVEDNGFPNQGCTLPAGMKRLLCRAVWNDQDLYMFHPKRKEKWGPNMPPYKSPIKGKKLYINNHDKELSVSLTDQPEDDWGWRINPLLLLCAIGNDYGGGDFHKGTGYEDIGRWAFDRISITPRPEFETTEYIFMESE